MQYNSPPGPHLAALILHESETTRVTGAADGSVWKEPLGADAARRLQHERAVLRRLAGVAGVAQLVGDTAPPQVLALGPRGERTLSGLLRERRLALAESLRLAEQLAQTLARVHAAGVVHAHVHPDNVVVAGPEALPVLIDFDLALLAREPAASAIPASLHCIAPEQTGRTGRRVDERADLYALGCLLYEMATGRRPFEGHDALQLMHDHLARAPVAPSALDPSVPEALSRIILRLLAKDPEQRYQSAQGLAHDLARLRDHADAERPAAFSLGDHDFGTRLPVPRRPAGRDREITALVDAFEDALRGGARGVLVSGAPGAGKSTLAQQLRPVVTARGGWFVSGKFESQRQDLDSDGLYQCLCALGRLLLALPEEELRSVRERLLDALGPGGGTLIAQVPEFALLLGTRPSAAALAHAPSAGERLVEVTLQTLRTVASPARPLVMVVDDLQWAPPLPISGIHAVLSDASAQGLFLVCIYRDGELAAARPLAEHLPRWQRLQAPPRHIAVPHLGEAGMQALLADMLRLSGPAAGRLAPMLLAHTDGNPFDTVQLLEALRREGALALRDGGWVCDAAAIPRQIAQGSVGKLLAGRLALLPPPTRELVDVLACLGGGVEMALLQACTGAQPGAILAGLQPAADDGLLLLPEEDLPTVRFSHDRVYQASVERLAPEEREQLQLSLARRLALHPDFALDAAHLYLQAPDAVADPAERLRAGELMCAGAKHLRHFNTPVADRLLAGATTLLAGAGAQGPALLSLNIERHAILYDMGRLDEAGALYARIEAECEDALQLAAATGVQVSALTNLGRPQDAVALGAAVLARLGVALPDAQELRVQMTQGSTVVFGRWLDPATVDLDLRRPDATDAKALAAGRLLDHMMPASFFCDPSLFLAMVLRGQALWATHGPAREFLCLIGHAAFASVGALGDYRTGRTLALAVLRIGEARGWEPETSQARFLCALGTAPWYGSLEDAVTEAQRAHQGLVDGGDLRNAAFTVYAVTGPLLDCGTLERYIAETRAALALSARTRNDYIAGTLLGHRQLGRAMRGGTASLGSFEDAEFSEVAHERAIAGSAVAELNYHTPHALAALVAGDDAGLIRHATAAAEHAKGTPAVYLSALARLLQALAMARRVRGAEPAGRAASLSVLDEARAFLAERAADMPANFRHLVAWVDAERAWATGDFRRTAACFDAAHQALEGLSRPWQRAVIAERWAQFLIENGLQHSGERAMARARLAYAAWGATAKVRALDACYPSLPGVSSPVDDDVAAQARPPAESIDLLGVLRASQALSSNTSLASLKASIVELLGSLTGATSVLLALWSEDKKQWLLSASSGNKGGAMPVDAAAQLGLLPLSVFQYAARTLEPLVVDDAAADDRFAADPYFADLERCSVLVFPILAQGAARAMLVLENSLARAAFSTARLDAVRLITGQLAVSLENARLYEELDQRVRERTRQLHAAQAKLVATARQAGKAEVASNVLHNVGNVLNSVNISASVVASRLRNSRGQSLGRAAALLQERSGDLAEFLTRDEKGRLLPGYLRQLAQALGQEQQEILEELANLTRSVDHIKNVVARQQSHAGATTVVEELDPCSLVEEALRINADTLQSAAVRIERDYAPVARMALDRPRVTDILVNLVRNAVQAMEGIPDACLTLRVEAAGQRLRLQVHDQGVGIPGENLTRIFSHGFTTRAGGHGFGLHSCALAAKEMGGKLVASSEGLGRGATFTLELPASETARGFAAFPPASPEPAAMPAS